MRSRILSYHNDHVILLPPGRSHRYDHFISEKKYFRVTFLPSADRRFFSTPHLRRLRGELKSSDTAMVLMTKSPYRDPSAAIIILLVWLGAGKTTTLIRPWHVTDEPARGAIPDPHDQALARGWLILPLNLRTLWDDVYWHLHRRFYPKDPWNIWEILVLVMFAGLILRRKLSIWFSSIVQILRGKRH